MIGSSGSVNTSEDVPEFESKLIQRLVHQKLDEMRQGDLYMEGLNQEYYEGILENRDVYSKFVGILGDTWMTVEGAKLERMGKKNTRRKKQFKKLLTEQESFIREEIAYYKTNVMKTGSSLHDDVMTTNDATSVSGKQLDLANQCSEVQEDQDETLEHLSTSNTRNKDGKSKSSKRNKKKTKKNGKIEKQKKKNRINGETSKNKRSIEHNYTNETDSYKEEGIESNASPQVVSIKHDMPDQQHNEEKAAFEKEKTDIISKIDDKTKEEFLAVGFALWSKTYLPCIQLGPYDVPPDGVRDSWMKMRNACAKGNRKLTRLIFWYGTTEENMAQGYSFLPSSKLLSYEEGCRKGYNTINKKRKDNVLFIDGMKELEEDEKREPDERLLRVRDHIVEKYVIEHEDDDYTSHNTLIAPGNETETMEDVPMEADIMKKKEVKKSKKRKKDSVNDQEEIPKKQEKQKKKKKKDNKENSIDKPEPKNPKTVEFNEKIEIKKAKEKKAKTSQTEVDDKIEYEVNEEENFYNDESSCEDANVDDDVYNTEIEESDEEYQIDESKKKKQKKRQSGESHVKRKTSKLKEKQRSMDGVPPKKKKKKKIENDEQTQIDAQAEHVVEQKNLERCERIFFPIMLKLDRAILLSNSDGAVECIENLHKAIEILTAPFIKLHGLGMKIKQTRKTFTGLNEVKGLCKEFTNDLKRIYLEKEKLVPKNFDPKAGKFPKPLEIGNKQLTEQVLVEVQSIPKPLHENTEPELADSAKTQSLPHTPKVKNETTPDKEMIMIKTKSSKIKRKKENYKIPSDKETTIVSNETPKNKRPFSLTYLLNKTPVPDDVPNRSSSRDMTETKLPKWLKVFESNKGFDEMTENRLFALEFLKQGAMCLNRSIVDYSSLARNLEYAISEYAISEWNKKPTSKDKKYSSEDDIYWEKVYAITASLSLKNEGTLAQNIEKGYYESPMGVVVLTYTQMDLPFGKK